MFPYPALHQNSNSCINACRCSERTQTAPHAKVRTLPHGPYSSSRSDLPGIRFVEPLMKKKQSLWHRYAYKQAAVASGIQMKGLFGGRCSGPVRMPPARCADGDPCIPCNSKGEDGWEGLGPGTAVGHCTFSTVQTLDRMGRAHVAGPWK